MRRTRHRLSGAALAAGLAPLVVSLVAEPARAGSASLDLWPWTPWLVVAGEQVTMAYVLDHPDIPLPS